jgi:glycine/D-amino acid oxidase-like deaminating enzyme
MNAIASDDISWRSFWLQQALAEDASLAPALDGSTTADVCIVGGGFLGMWTAIRLKEASPELDVVIIEKDICGGGPSGRNSGMLLPAWPKFSALAALRGEEEAMRVVRMSTEAIDGIEAFCKANGIDGWFDRVGWIWGATCEAQVGAWSDAVNKLAKHGHVPAREVGRDEIFAMTGSRGYLSGVLDTSSATIHPGFLVRGLRRAALARGVRIYEKSPMRRFSRKDPIVIETDRGRVVAGRLVLAMNAWSAMVHELAPAIFNISSDDTVSKPMPERLAEVGYTRGPLMSDCRVFVTGHRVTRDGRLNVGVTGGYIGFGSIVDQRFNSPSPRLEDMRQSLRVAHPALADFVPENTWNGPIDRTDSGLPLFGHLPSNPNIFYGYGFSGNGIGLTYVGGRIVSSLVLGKNDEFATCALVRPVRRGFPPEPFRFVGALFVRGAVRRRDRFEHLNRKVDPLTSWFASLAPSGVTPSKANITP